MRGDGRGVRNEVTGGSGEGVSGKKWGVWSDVRRAKGDELGKRSEGRRTRREE